jgi:outer membrane protein OmpA-like peptidoglycan-associated protein
MRPQESALVAAILLTACVAGAQSKDVPGSKDPALFTRMPHYILTDYKESPFDAYEFTIQKGNDTADQRVEGHKVEYRYDFDSSAGVPAGMLQIARNYQNATIKVGGKTLYFRDQGSSVDATFLIARNGQENWVFISCQGSGAVYFITIVEKQAMQQDVTANADVMKSGLTDTGHAEVPGIFFDFNKSEVKPESQPALAEVVKLLRANPGLRVWVVGHTDNVGAVDANVALSNARAAAVVAALVKLGIDTRRLTPHGDGPYAPVASNSTDEGRAHNRRVELVAQP